MDVLRQDLLFAFRMLRKDRAYAAAVILTLAICLGANTAIFTVVRSVLLRPLPYPSPSRLAFMFDGFPGAGVERAGTSVPNYLDRVPLTEVFDSVALYQNGGFRVGAGRRRRRRRVDEGQALVLHGAAHEGGSRALLHRGGRRRPARSKVVVLSQAFAARQPGGIDGVVGRQLRLNDEPYVVVGVAPEELHLPGSQHPDLGPAGLHSRAACRRQPLQPEPRSIARLADGATLEQAQARLDALNVVNSSGPGRSRARWSTRAIHTRRAPLPTTWCATCARRSSCCGAACCSWCSLRPSTSRTCRSCVRAGG